MTKSVHVIVEGKVQGVWYRAWVLGAAQKLGLFGWVRNKSNGQVEAVFCGDIAKVDKMIEQCWHGSPPSSVSNVTVSPADKIADPRFVVIKSS